MPIQSEIDSLRLIYKEVLEGFSVADHDGQKIFIKHLNELDHIDVLSRKVVSFEGHLKNGVPSEQDKLKTAISFGEWGADKEDEILSLKWTISDNEKNLQNIIAQQRPPIIKIVDGLKQKLRKITHERSSVIGETAERFAEKEAFHYLIYASIYKDEKNRLFESFEEFYEEKEEKEAVYGELLEKTLEKINHKAVSQIACLGFFLNPLSYAKDNLYFFLGKPISELTHYQTSLFSLGLRNLRTLSESSGSPPDLLDQTNIDDIVFWYDKEYSVAFTKRNSSS